MPLGEGERQAPSGSVVRDVRGSGVRGGDVVHGLGGGAFACGLGAGLAVLFGAGAPCGAAEPDGGVAGGVPVGAAGGVVCGGAGRFG